MKKKLAVLSALITMLAFHSPAIAQDASPPFLPAPELASHRTTIARLEKYMSGLSTIISDFTQTAPDGTLTSGKFYLERPGKMRWQYHPPTPILMVSNGSSLVYYDYELEQSSHIPLDQTLIGFMAQEVIRFDGLVGVTDITEQPGVIRINLAQRNKPDEGQLMLEFSDQPLQLRNMVIRDSARQVTTVALNNARFGLKMDPELFIFREPGKKHKIH
jgi:outer membrane lipoprotein-sorting protein